MFASLRRVFEAGRNRYLDVLASVYLYNEHRGYTSLDRVLAAVRARCPENALFLEAVEKHRADERKHYLMFQRYFQLRKVMPLQVGRACGHIDHFIETAFGCTIDDLDTDAIIADGALFEKLCRVIMITEIRGMHQVDTLLRSRLIQSDSRLVKIFEIIRQDEPSHWQPYHAWLTSNGRVTAKFSERMTDFSIHKSLMLAKLPALFFNRRLPRQLTWPDHAERTSA